MQCVARVTCLVIMIELFQLNMRSPSLGHITPTWGPGQLLKQSDNSCNKGIQSLPSCGLFSGVTNGWMPKILLLVSLKG